MPAEENRVFALLGMLQSQMTSLDEKVETFQERSTDEHRKVHQIIDAQSEAIRNLTRMVEEMKPLTEDYREKRAEARGAAKFATALWVMVGSLIMFIATKLSDIFTTRPHPIIIAMLLVMSTQALAQEHRHPDQVIQGATALFYETWMRPDMPSSSCCNRSDCDVAVDVKRIGNQLWARKRSGGPLVSIPPEKIEVNRDSPDGQSHLCAIRDMAICFIAGSGG